MGAALLLLIEKQSLFDFCNYLLGACNFLLKKTGTFALGTAQKNHAFVFQIDN